MALNRLRLDASEFPPGALIATGADHRELEVEARERCCAAGVYFAGTQRRR
jgi:hypothetical protein